MKLQTLLAWHQSHPVDDVERLRNDLIFQNYQGNRNPFIDHPEWVALIFSTDAPVITDQPQSLAVFPSFVAGLELQVLRKAGLSQEESMLSRDRQDFTSQPTPEVSDGDEPPLTLHWERFRWCRIRLIQDSQNPPVVVALGRWAKAADSFPAENCQEDQVAWADAGDPAGGRRKT